MRHQQGDGPDQKHHPLRPDGLHLLGASGQQEHQKRRAPDARNPPVKPADYSQPPFRPVAMVQPDRQIGPHQLQCRKGRDRHPQQQKIDLPRDHSGKGSRQCYADHGADQKAVISGGRLPGRRHALPEGLRDVGHQGRKDQPGQGQIGGQKDRKGRDQDHRHCKADRPFHDACEKGDGQGRQQRFATQPGAQEFDHLPALPRRPLSRSLPAGERANPPPRKIRCDIFIRLPARQRNLIALQMRRR